jgi:serine/threonine protein kinase
MKYISQVKFVKKKEENHSNEISFNFFFFLFLKRGIVHRDLAARNLLVTEVEGSYIVKVSFCLKAMIIVFRFSFFLLKKLSQQISDLGMSREIGGDVYSSSDNNFPVKWSPPEVINHRQYSTKSDVWSYMVNNPQNVPFCSLS